jgi:Transposase DDE domain group 1
LNEHTTTDCLLFPDIFDRPVVAKFDQRQGSSDGGAILLQAAERRLGLTSALAAGLRDDRQPGKVQHELRELITQRVMAIALGYEDANDAARLAGDPIHKLLVGRDPIAGEDLASQPTLSRFENAPNRKELLRMTAALADRVIETTSQGLVAPVGSPLLWIPPTTPRTASNVSEDQPIFDRLIQSGSRRWQYRQAGNRRQNC